LCSSSDLDRDSYKEIESELHSVKFSTIEIRANDIPESHYLNHLTHTLHNCNSVIYVINSTSAKATNFLRHLGKIANAAKLRVYFIYLDAQEDDITSSLQESLQIPTEISLFLKSQVEKIGTHFRTTGQIVTTISEDGSVSVETDSYDHIIFDVPLYSGKFYYEVNRYLKFIIQIPGNHRCSGRTPNWMGQ
jgi:hypothetical protein